MRIPAFIMLSLLAVPVAAHAEDKPAKSDTSAAALLSGGQTLSATESKSSTVPVGEDYVCPMHKDVHGKKGGVCPICGMPLVPAHADKHNMTSAPEQGKADTHE